MKNKSESVGNRAGQMEEKTSELRDRNPEMTEVEKENGEVFKNEKRNMRTI